MRVTQAVENSQPQTAAARHGVGSKSYHLSSTAILRAGESMVPTAEEFALVGMRTRPTTNLQPLTALLGLMLDLARSKLPYHGPGLRPQFRSRYEAAHLPARPR
jgi:hypothetical protein